MYDIFPINNVYKTILITRMMSILDQVLISIVYGGVIITVGIICYMLEHVTDRFVVRIDQLTQQNKELTDRLAESSLANDDDTTDDSQHHKDTEISLFKENAELSTRCALLIQEIESLKVRGLYDSHKLECM